MVGQSCKEPNWWNEVMQLVWIFAIEMTIELARFRLWGKGRQGWKLFIKHKTVFLSPCNLQPRPISGFSLSVQLLSLRLDSLLRNYKEEPIAVVSRFFNNAILTYSYRRANLRGGFCFINGEVNSLKCMFPVLSFYMGPLHLSGSSRVFVSFIDNIVLCIVSI